MNKWNLGDKVKYFLNSTQYTEAEIVEKCDDNTVWVRLSNGQEKQLKAAELISLN